MNNFTKVTCIKCGWVSVAVSRKFAISEVKKFNKYFNSLSEKEQIDFYNGKKSSIKEYRCMLCGCQKFKKSKPEDCPDGCTLNPVICEKLEEES